MFHSPPLTGDKTSSATRHSGETQEQKEPQRWNSPLKSVLPAHVEDWRRGAAQRMLKHFLRTHKSLLNGFPLARSSSGGGDYFFFFYYQHLKGCRSPWASCETHPLCFFSLRCLLMTRMPVCNSLNNYRQDSEDAVMKCGFHDHVCSSVLLKNAC